MTSTRQDAARSGRRWVTLLGRAASVLVTLVLAIVVLASLAVSVRIAMVAARPHDRSALLAQQVAWLESRPRDDAAPAASGVPEGEVLHLAWTGLAVAGDEGRAPAVRLATLRSMLGQLDSLSWDSKQPGSTAADPRDVARSGWSLFLATEVARLSNQENDRAEVRRRAAPLLSALAGARLGLLSAGTGPVRPVDTIVVAAGLRRADEVAGVPGAATTLRVWVPRLEPLRDPSTKLFPHLVGSDGRRIEGPRATSQAVIQVFWPSLDPATSSRDWVAFENTFLCPRLGLATVCEYPDGGGGGDALSGPLIFGVSFPATVVAMAAARAHGNPELADQISREAELFGLPLVEDGRRRHLVASTPLGESLLAWSRAVPAGPELPGVDDRDPVAWTAWTLAALIPGIFAAGGLTVLFMARRTTLSGPLDPDAAPPDEPSGAPWESGPETPESVRRRSERGRILPGDW